MRFSEVKNHIRTFPPDVHKKSRGRVMIYAGSPLYPGAGALAATAALRAGAGYVRLFCEAPPYGKVPNALIVSLVSPGKNDFSDCDAVCAGPGWGGHAGMKLRKVLRHAPRLLLDADALNTLSQTPSLWEERREGLEILMTPHPGEAARLCRAFGIDERLPRESLAQSLAEKLDCTVLLKGRESVIASPGKAPAVNACGGPELATMGSGDVLSGIAAALLAQNYPAQEAAEIAAALHGRAGELSGRGLIADDLPELLPEVWKELC